LGQAEKTSKELGQQEVTNEGCVAKKEKRHRPISKRKKVRLHEEKKTEKGKRDKEK